MPAYIMLDENYVLYKIMLIELATKSSTQCINQRSVPLSKTPVQLLVALWWTPLFLQLRNT